MAEPRERLREILCPDSEVDNAIKILERLIELGEGAHREHVITEGWNEEKFEIFRRLHYGGLLGSITTGNRESYYLNHDGKELYKQLVKVEKH